MTSSTNLPIHDSLNVVNRQDIYQHDEWWKSVVQYSYDSDEEYTEVAVYLWHKDDEWSRKNKYVIKTEEAWKTDKTIIQTLLDSSEELPVEDGLPVSDYYEVAGSKTVFQSDGWWKAIAQIEKKGSYETEEVMVYLWQNIDGEWRRRQKYTIKSKQKWKKESEAIESILGTTVSVEPVQTDATTSESGTESNVLESGEFAKLANELDNHLSRHTADSN
jgi:hypothetical protein